MQWWVSVRIQYANISGLSERSFTDTGLGRVGQASLVHVICKVLYCRCRGVHGVKIENVFLPHCVAAYGGLGLSHGQSLS